MRILYIISILLITVACTDREEVVDLEDIMPTSDYDKNSTADTVVEQAAFIPSIDPIELETAKIVWDSVVINEELTVPERFSPKNMEKFTYWVGGKSVEYNRWSFPDSSKTTKAFLNWMNCYGERCLMVELRITKNIQRNTLLILQNDTSIVQIQSPTMGLSELNKWKQLYLDPEKAKWNYIVTQPRGRKAIWSWYKDKEESEFVQLEND